MKKKNLTMTFMAVALFSVLAISFFIGGNDNVVPLNQDEIEQDVVAVVDEIAPAIDKNENLLDSEEALEDNLEKEMNHPIPEQTEAEERAKETKQEPVSDETKDVRKETKQEAEKEPSKQQRVEQPQERVKEQPIEAKPVEKQSKQEIIKEQKAEKEQIIAEDKTNLDKKDKYLTDPVPEGKPKPVEWQEVTIEKDKPLSASLSVTAKTILNNMHLFNQDKLEVLPADGVIYPKQTVTFYQGESVFDVLLREMQANKIHMEFVMTPIYNSHYIEGINNIYEFDCGELSGWMYKVNGWFPNYGASRYQLQDGDVIDWVYTCDLGRDIGGGSAIGGGQ